VFWFSHGDFKSDTACLKLNIKTESVAYFINSIYNPNNSENMPIYLTPTEVKDCIPAQTGRWNVITNDTNVAKHARCFKSTIKLKFECDCHRKWTTMKGKCEVKLWKSPLRNNICVVIYQQKCQKCQRWAEPLPYAKEFDSIIKQKIEKWQNPVQKKGGPRFRMTGEMKKSHDSARCEACQLRKCSARGF
jgi:hypothetical protein